MLIAHSPWWMYPPDKYASIFTNWKADIIQCHELVFEMCISIAFWWKDLPNYHLNISIWLQFLDSHEVLACGKTLVMCFILPALMYPALFCAIHATLSSHKVAGVFVTKSKSHVLHIWWITDFNQTHSWLTSWSASIYEWLDDVATNVCFMERHVIVVPPRVNT